ncbi:ABC transporter ATP-binding protein [Sphingobium sp. AS12]|uniref:ABC transporter ATP-binding protein n=1 Tax=Sphingobium sp. AS12 TaxID=2849495 RepID=UPI001C31D0FF|nr:ABC transporter ATP-binding protein [Sphingobium sp. AS12]MBV2149860.1 ABC transporter ATP-binding protein [Sphingobium sp. AS12]
MTCIEARNLSKAFGPATALDGINLTIEEGSIVGLIGPNGSGKSTLLRTIVGLLPHEGDLAVLGRDPWRERAALMRDVSYIADVAVLPPWINMGQALDYVGGVHPRFDRAKAEAFLHRTSISRRARVRDLSKGMAAQLHLALVMAIEARLTVLDEPTLGLDVAYRKAFYDALLGDHLDHDRTILMVTHELAEIERVLDRIILLDHGRVKLDFVAHEIDARFTELVAHPDHLAAARALGPIQERLLLGQSVFLFDGVDRDEFRTWGDLRTPSLTDLFTALVTAKSDQNDRVAA